MSLHYFTADLLMGGWPKTSIHDVTARGLRYHCSKSKTLENASVATPMLSGNHLLMIALSKWLIILRCYSTSLARGTSQTVKQATRFTNAESGDLYSWGKFAIPSYAQSLNHLIEINIAFHFQITLVIVIQLIIL